MRLDERIDDEQADIVFLDLFDARIDIGLPDNLIVALHLCEQQRTIGAGVQRDADPDLREWQGGVQESTQPALELIKIIFGVVDPGLDHLVHRFIGEVAAGRDGDRPGDTVRRLADTSRGDKQSELSPQEGPAEDPAAPGQSSMLRLSRKAGWSA